jgi:hypothetical protein
MIWDLSNVPHAIRKRMAEILTQDFDLKAMHAIKRQRAIAAQYAGKRMRANPVLGEHQMALHKFLDLYWRKKRGNDVWEDEDFKKWFIKRHDEVRVNCGGEKTGVGYGTGQVPVIRPRHRKFVKHYA